MIKIAGCDDESEIRKSIANLIKKHIGDVEISAFQSGKEMLETTANFETSGDGENGIFKPVGTGKMVFFPVPPAFFIFLIVFCAIFIYNQRILLILFSIQFTSRRGVNYFPNFL